MKGANGEDKMLGPLFPRLHVNDTDKGGPRAPPRNKMALYEQFSIPSQRFNSASSTLLLPPSNANNLAPSNSLSQGCGPERGIVSPSYMPSYAPRHASDRVDSQLPDGMHPDKTREFERKSGSNANYRNSGGTRSVAECSTLREDDSNAKDSRRKLNDVDDFTVPTFDQPGNAILSKKDAPFAAPKNLALSNKPLEQIKTAGVESGNFNRTHCGRKFKENSGIEESREMPLRDRVAEKTSTGKVSDDRDGTDYVRYAEKSTHGNAALCQESSRNVNISRPRILNDATDETGNTSTVRNELYHRETSAKGQRTSNFSGNHNQEDGANENLSLKVESIDEVSDASIVDCISGLEISPDDVVGVIGPKHFWRARRAIANQQRVFAIQVFELHRIIKVQKLIASSPHLLLEGNAYFLKSSAKAPNEMPLPEQNTNSQLHAMREKDALQKPSQNAEPARENIVGHPSLPAGEDGLNGLRGPVPSAEHCSANPQPVATVPDNNATPWLFHPPPSQWLVPVMSPSEGLVYKPYSGPCPPTGGIMAPIYGSCTPLGVAPLAGDFMNPAYGVPSSHRPPKMSLLPGPPAIASNYFPTPYGLQAINPMVSNSVVEQVRNLAGSRPTGQMDQHSRNSCNMSNPRSEAFSGRHWKLLRSKDSELQGSTASSPSGKAQLEEKDAVAIFPTASATNNLARPSQSSGRDSQTRVIKVVPHNARSASESAARIFRSIQEGRELQE